MQDSTSITHAWFQSRVQGPGMEDGCVGLYLVLVLAIQLTHLVVHQVLDGADLSLHLLLGGF